MAEFGLFDLLSPALSRIDDVLSSGLAFAPVWRIAFFAAFGSIASMSIFKGLSNQAELQALKQEIKSAQQNLADREMPAGDLRRAVLRSLRLSGKQLRLSLWPALVASVPILFLLAFSSNQFGVEPPEAGSRVYVTPKDFQISPSRFEWHGVNAQWDARKKAWTFYQPDTGQAASLMLDGRKQLALPLSVPATVIHKKRWWNYLVANPAGYLDENSSIGLFGFNTTRQSIIDWGPEWMRGWAFAFLSFLILFSIVIKVVWKIH